MMKVLRDFRLIPVVLIAAGCLLALKGTGIVLDGGYTLGQRLGRGDTMVVTTVPVPAATTLRSETTPLQTASARPNGARQSWMQEMFNYPDITGSVSAPKPAAKDAAKEPAENESPGKTMSGAKAPGKGDHAPESKAVAGTKIPLDAARPVSASERAILERLQGRRHELEARARELDVRESLLKAAEKKLEVQPTGPNAMAKTGEAPDRQKDVETARFKGVVTMYETMKPKDAAKIFDRLDMKVLLDVASSINPRRMSEILAQMSPEAAERLTVELASRGPATEKALNPSDLPKIGGNARGS